MRIKEDLAKVKDQLITDQYSLYNGDSTKVLKGIPDDSIGCSIYSPPFASLYTYSDSEFDLGNCRDYGEFFRHYEFIVKELYRIMMPGRITAIHCMDLPTHKSKGEEIGLRDFSGDIIRLHQECGFIFHSRHCIWKDPLIAATRTKALGLAHKQIVKDSSRTRTGIPDYILAFRKPGENPVPIKHPQGLTEYAGERSIPRDLDRYIDHVEQGANKRSHWIWQQYASPVWFDIDQTKVLPFRKGRDPEDQRHVCPLQLQVIERCLTLWSTPGDIVLSPFMGVASEIYVAVSMGRKGLGIELKPSYFRQAKRNMESLRVKRKNSGMQLQ